MGSANSLCDCGKKHENRKLAREEPGVTVRVQVIVLTPSTGLIPDSSMKNVLGGGVKNIMILSIEFCCSCHN